MSLDIPYYKPDPFILKAKNRFPTFTFLFILSLFIHKKKMEAYYSQFAEVFSTLPEGYLPKWLLFTSALGIFNSIQNFCTSSLTKRVYANKPEEGIV